MKHTSQALCTLCSLLIVFVSAVFAPQSAAAQPAQVAVCPTAAPGHARCLAYHPIRNPAQPAAPSPNGLTPQQLQAAYNLPSGTAGAGRTVAIVDAFDNPNAEADLAVYRSTYGLPLCTTANKCFRKVNQRGSTKNLPKPDAAWGDEIALDLDMVSAICPKCKIVLVEADDDANENLYKAVRTAVRLGATTISNSWGTDEYAGEAKDSRTYFRHPHTPIVAATGDSGAHVYFPSSSQYVIAAGGTALNYDSNSQTWSETAWKGTGGGCSAFIPKPVWQKDGGCAKRTVADLAAVASGSLGVSVYNTYDSFQWLQLYGTSVSSPVIAAVYALGHPRRAYYARSAYQNAAALKDIVSGTNGTCDPAYLCTALPGYDAPTGNGVPNGIGGF